MTLEQALDRLITDLQGALNQQQCALRELAALEEQDIDPEEDFKAAVALDDNVVDLVELMVGMLKELPTISKDIRGSPPPALREWFKQHVADRKAEKKLERERMKAEKSAGTSQCSGSG